MTFRSYIYMFAFSIVLSQCGLGKDVEVFTNNANDKELELLKSMKITSSRPGLYEISFVSDTLEFIDVFHGFKEEERHYFKFFRIDNQGNVVKDFDELTEKEKTILNFAHQLLVIKSKYDINWIDGLSKKHIIEMGFDKGVLIKVSGL